jgi:hypothetical protein
LAEPTVYKLYLQPGLKLILALVLAAMLMFGIGLTSWSLWWPNAKAPPLPFGLIWFAISAIYLIYFLRLPHRISLNEDGTVEFISILRQRTVRADEIKSIQPEGTQFGFFMVRTERGKIRILAQFDGFHDFLARLQARHPGVELRGC